MTFSVTMPALGESVTEGTVTRWLKNEGDMVAVDEPLLEVSTDKVDTEIPSPVAGILQKIVVAVDSTVAVGAELAVIADGATGASAPAPVVAAPVVQAPAPVAPVVAAPVVAAPVAVASSTGTIVTMPALGESVTEGTVTRWLKIVGDQVTADEALLEVSTDKVDTEIPSPASGTLLSIDVAVDSTVPVGARLAVIGGANAPVAVAAPAPVTPAPVVAAPVVAAPAPIRTAPAAVSNEDAYVTPIVRKFATENNVDLSKVTGTGIGGRIRKEDVLAAAPKAAAPTFQSAPVASAGATTTSASAPVAVSPLRGTTVTMS